jgi:hypothetical protein
VSLLSVYVEGAKDTSAQGVRRLAALIAARYGLSAGDLEKRIASGRFRVKANVDEATARAFVDDLEKLGARCMVMEVEPSPASPRGVAAMPALEAPSEMSLAAERVAVSSRSVPAMASGETGGSPPRTEPEPARTPTPPQRTISVSAAPPIAARTATPGVGAVGPAGTGARPRPPTAGGFEAIDNDPPVPARTGTPVSGIPPAARTISSVARGATPAVSQPALPRTATPAASQPALPSPARAPTPPTSQPAQRTISSASVPPPTGAAGLLAHAAARRAEDPQADLVPPTLRGLASAERARTPAQSQPALPATSRTSTLPLSGLPPRPAASPTAPPTGLASALANANATYGSGASGGGSGLGALDGASFSLSTLDGHDDAPAVPSYDYDEPSSARRGAASRPASAYDEPMASLAAMEALTPVETFPPMPPLSASSAPLPPAAPPRRPDDIPSVSPHLGIQVQFSSPAAATRPPRLARVSGVTGTAAADPFTPPMNEPLQLQLAADDRPRRTSLHASAAPEGAPMMAPAIAPASRSGGSGASVAAATERRTRRRTAFAIGVLASVLLAFVPAHLLAQSRERTAFERIDNRVRIAQSEIASLAEWQALDDVRTALHRQKKAAHHEIIIASMSLWIALAGALAFAWARFGVRRFDPADPDPRDA